MTHGDAAGYLASGLVFATFCMKEMIPLRIVGICSNLAFIVYGVGLGLVPIWALHAILLPMNCWRLWQALRPSALLRVFGPFPRVFRVKRSKLRPLSAK